MGRVTALDGLRGIAALVVVIHHGALVVPGWRDAICDTVVLRPLLAGPQAVQLFLVLSGFVLFRACAARPPELVPWAARRTVRLLPPLAACVVLSEALVLALDPHPIPALSGWFNDVSWHDAAGWSPLLRNLLPLDGEANHQLDNATWSLVHEWRLSLLFPLVAASVARRPRLTFAAALLLAAVTPSAPRETFDLLYSAHFLWLLCAGAVLAHGEPRLAAWFATRAYRAPLTLIVALGLFASTGSLAPTVLTALGGILLLCVVVGSPLLRRPLEAAWPQWLGERSYSLYLVHLPVLLACVHLLHGAMPLPAILGIAAVLCGPATALVWRWVEQPALRLSQRLGRMSRSPANARADGAIGGPARA